MNIKEKITNSQMLLVGLGEELDLYRKIRKSPEYHAACEKVENTAIHSYLLAYFLENRLKENQEIYQNLVKILEHKNYFMSGWKYLGFRTGFEPGCYAMWRSEKNAV